MVRAEGVLEAHAAYAAFLQKWLKLVPAVDRSLEEASQEPLNFYLVPKSLWRSVRTTNALENLNRELRLRTKTQGSFPTEAAGVHLRRLPLPKSFSTYWSH